MRFYVTLTTLLVFAVFAPLACNKKDSRSNQAGGRAQSEEQTVATPSDGVRRISISEAQNALTRGEAVVVDVRGGVEYNLGHIKGSLSVPLGLIAQQAGDLPRDKLIITYCACTHEQLSIRGVEEMKKIGIENAAALVGGWDAWVKAGLPTETSE